MADGGHYYSGKRLHLNVTSSVPLVSSDQGDFTVRRQVMSSGCMSLRGKIISAPPEIPLLLDTVFTQCFISTNFKYFTHCYKIEDGSET